MPSERWMSSFTFSVAVAVKATVGTPSKFASCVHVGGACLSLATRCTGLFNAQRSRLLLRLVGDTSKEERSRM